MDEYDSSKPTKYLQYLDANNLYGWAMSQPLPTGGFRWVKCDSNPNKLFEKFAAKKDYGYLLEVLEVLSIWYHIPKSYTIYITIFHSCVQR